MDNNILLEWFANGIVKWEYSDEQIKSAAQKIGMDNAKAVLSIVNNVDSWSWLDEIKKQYPNIDPKTITNIHSNLSEYKKQADMVANNDKFKLSDIAIPLIWAGTIWGIYWIKKGIWLAKEYIPITATKAKDTANYIRKITMGNYSEIPEVGDKRVDNFVDYIQAINKKELSDISSKWFRWLYDKFKWDLNKLTQLKQQILADHWDKKVWREEVLWDLEKEIEAVKKTNPSRATALQKVHKEYSQLFDNEAKIQLDEYMNRNVWNTTVTTNFKTNYDNLLNQAKQVVKLPLTQVEWIKEWAYSNYDNYDQKVWASAADLQQWEWYRIVGKSSKKALEMATNWELIEPNSQYGKIKSFENTISKLSNKAATQETYSLWRKIWWIAGEAVSKLPLIKSWWFPKLSQMAVEEKHLPKVLESIRKWGDKIKINGKTISEVESIASEMVNKSIPIIKNVSWKVGKVAWKVGKVWWALAVIWAVNELAWGSNIGEAQAGNVKQSPSVKQQYLQANTPKYGNQKITSTNKKFVNPEPIIQPTNLTKWSPTANILAPEAGILDLATQWLSFAERKIRERLNK